MMKQNYTLLFGIVLAGLIAFSGCVSSDTSDDNKRQVKTTSPSLPPILAYSANQPIGSEADVRALFTNHASEILNWNVGDFRSENEGLELKLQSLKITDIPPKESIVYSGGPVGGTLGQSRNITSEWAVQVSAVPIGKPFRATKDAGVYEYLAGKEYVHPDTGGLCAEAISSDGSPIPPSGCIERDYWQPALQFIYGISPNGEVVLSNAFELGLEAPIPGAQY